MAHLKKADFIAFDKDFLSFLGQNAKLEVAQSFEGEDANHVHEAPVYIPDTGDFVFADTSVVGWLWVLNIETNKVCHSKPSFRRATTAYIVISSFARSILNHRYTTSMVGR